MVMEQLEFAFCISSLEWEGKLRYLYEKIMGSTVVCRSYEEGDEFSGKAVHSCPDLPEYFSLHLWGKTVYFRYNGEFYNQGDKVIIEYKHGLRGKYFTMSVDLP